MIVRKQPNGELLLIGQTDHSQLVGQLAAHWGNKEFATPQPYDSVIRAATFHDYGWLRYETSPLIHPETGEPYQFLEAPMDAERLEAYQWSLDWLAGIDRYSGLIINMHRTGLWKGRYQTIKHPGGYNIRKMSPGVQEFIDRNEARQAEERRALDRDNVWTNYRLMQVWDLLGLYFCCQDPYDDHIDPVPQSYAGAKDEGVRLTLSPGGAGRVAVDPYPFDVRPCRVQLMFKRLPKTTFADLEAFRRSYFQAQRGLMEFELV
jgi:hypothetical protein